MRYRFTFLLVLYCFVSVLPIEATEKHASEELKVMFDKITVLISNLDDSQFFKEQHQTFVQTINNKPLNKLDCYYRLLQLQINSNDIKGTKQTIDIIQKEIISLNDSEQKNSFHVLLAISFMYLHLYQDSITEIKKIDDPISRIQIAIIIADIYFNDQSIGVIGIESIIESAIEDSIDRKQLDKEAVLTAIKGAILAKSNKIVEAKKLFEHAYMITNKAIKVAGQNDRLIKKTKSPSGITFIATHSSISLYDAPTVEKQLMIKLLRYQTIAGFVDDAFTNYTNYTFVSGEPEENQITRFVFLGEIVQTLIGQNEVMKAIDVISKDTILPDISTLSILIADTLGKEGNYKTLFELMDNPRFKSPQAQAGILMGALNVVFENNSQEIIKQLNKYFPKIEIDKLLRSQNCQKLINDGKWDEAISLIKTFEKDGQDEFLFPTTQMGILKPLTYTEWQKGHFDHVAELVTIIQTDEMKEQIKHTQKIFEEEMKNNQSNQSKKREQFLQEICFRQRKLLDFDGFFKTNLAMLDMINENQTDSPERKLNKIVDVLFGNIHIQEFDMKRRDEILEKGWNMILNIDNISHIDRIDAMFRNNKNKECIYKIAEFALQTDNDVDKISALFIVVKEIIKIEMEYKNELYGSPAIVIQPF